MEEKISKKIKNRTDFFLSFKAFKFGSISCFKAVSLKRLVLIFASPKKIVFLHSCAAAFFAEHCQKLETAQIRNEKERR